MTLREVVTPTAACRSTSAEFGRASFMISYSRSTSTVGASIVIDSSRMVRAMWADTRPTPFGHLILGSVGWISATVPMVRSC